MAQRITELSEGDAVRSYFVAATQTTGVTRHGSEYWTVTLRDSTGSIQARIWEPAAAAPDGVEIPGVVEVSGRVEKYRDSLQLNVEKIRAFEPDDEQYGALVATSRWASDTLLDAIRDHVQRAIRSDLLRDLLLDILARPEVAERFPTAPAASHNHHAYRSGLAEHALSGMRLASVIADHYAAYYPGLIDGDLLVAGFLLHDMAKIWEMSGELAVEYTTPGRLIGHIPMGAMFIERVARERGDVPDTLLWELQHLILSHHGEYEYGSPKRPKTVEAQILHYIDQIDAKANVFASLAGKGEGWSEFQRNMGRPVLVPGALRDSWTTPPPGEVGPQGPGLPLRELADLPTGRKTRPKAPASPVAASVAEQPPTADGVRTEPPTDVSAPDGPPTAVDTAEEPPALTLGLFDGME